MNNTLLIALSRQIASYQAMNVIANNLANMSTPAYKRESVQFKQYVDQIPAAAGQDGPQSISFVQDAGVVRDMREGQLVRTNAPFDLAISGKGYFEVQTANGMRYTRNGHFSLDAQGRIVNTNGDPLIGGGGPITVTPQDGDIHIASDGTVSGKQGQLGKIGLVDFANDGKLIQEGASLYKTSQQPTPVQTPKIVQGMIENSNVQPVVEMSHMLEVMRNYEATASLTKSLGSLKRQAIEKLGSVAH